MTYHLKACLHDFVTEWLRPRRAELKRPGYAIDRLLEFFGADKDAGTFKRKDYRAYISWRRKAGVVDATIKRELSVLRSALTFAVEEEAIDGFAPMKLPSDSPARERWLTEAEAGKLMEQEMDPRVRLVLYIAFATGARRGAILGLKVGRVDFAGGFIDFRDPDKPVTKKVRVKTKMAEWLRPVLVKACEGKGAADLVVDLAEYGEPGKYVSTQVKRLLRKIGIDEPGIAIHAVRRTFTTWAFLGGAKPVEVSAATGASIQTLEKHYLRVFPEHAAGATNTIKSLTGE